MIFLNHLVRQIKQTNQTMHSVELGSPKPTKIKGLISEWMCSRGLQASNSTKKPGSFGDDLLKVKVSVMNLQQFYKMTARCDLYIKPIGRYSPESSVSRKGKCWQK